MALTVAEIVDHLFTHPNPATGSLPPADLAWVVFTHGTVFCHTAPDDALPLDATFDALAAAACAALSDLGPAFIGSFKGDFNASRLDGWFPDEPVWCVTFDRQDVFTIVVMEGEPLAAGLTGRGQRDLDVAEQTIALIRRFDGTTR